MKIDRKKMIAETIKNGRLIKGLTQKELSELTNISIRSIQRIENAELEPRSYTLKTIAQVLDIPFSSFNSDLPTEIVKDNKSQTLGGNNKLILSIAISILIILSAMAFLSQSPKFPETNFEGFIFWIFITIIIATFLYVLWHPKKT